MGAGVFASARIGAPDVRTPRRRAHGAVAPVGAAVSFTYAGRPLARDLRPPLSADSDGDRRSVAGFRV